MLQPLFLIGLLGLTHAERWAHKIFDLGNGFELSEENASNIRITHGDEVVWQTDRTKPFVSASSSDDIIIESDGAFNITNVDLDRCQRQSVDSIGHISWPHALQQSAVELRGNLSGCGSDSVPYSLVFWIDRNLTDRVAFNLSVADYSYARLKRVYLSFGSDANEDFYGLGAQASFASLKNRSIRIFSREQGVGREDQPITRLENENGTFSGGNRFTTYSAIPSYISTSGRVFYLAETSSAYATFDFTDPTAITVRYDHLRVSGAFGIGKDMFEAVEMLTAYTGRMPHLPKWVDNGAVLGLQGGQEKVMEVLHQGQNMSCPTVAVWLQDWVGTHSQSGPYLNVSRLWWNWENDEVLYPTWNTFVQNLRTKHNVRTLSYVNCFLTNVSTKPDGFRRNLYDEASVMQYFVQNTTVNGTAVISSGPDLDAGIIDLTNPALRSWFAAVLKDQVWDARISGFMSDFGEYTPITSDTRLSDGQNPFFAHNQYPLWWAEFQREVINDLELQSDAVVFHRSAAMGANRYMNLFWAGDQNPNWGVNDGLKSVVTIMASMGLSGYSQLHSDIGGYTDTLTYDDYNVTRSAELLGRWGELAAVSSSVFRTHEGNIPSVNAQFYTNASTYSYLAYNARMFASLGPYRRRILETECETKGWPLLRHPAMYHPNDAEARKISYQSFYLGPALYVAPVLDQHTFELSVYLPSRGSDELQDTFTHVWTGKKFSGGQTIKVSAPYGKPAVFLVGKHRTKELQTFLEFASAENQTLLAI